MLVYSICVVPMRQERPYHSDSTASRLLSEVKHCRARLVLRWGTTLESLVLFFCSFLLSMLISDFSPVHRIALQYSFCSDRLAWHGGKAMTICTYFVSYYLLMLGVAVPPLECWNNWSAAAAELSCICVSMLPISPERWWKDVASFSTLFRQCV